MGAMLAAVPHGYFAAFGSGLRESRPVICAHLQAFEHEALELRIMVTKAAGQFAGSRRLTGAMLGRRPCSQTWIRNASNISHSLRPLVSACIQYRSERPLHFDCADSAVATKRRDMRGIW